MLEDRKAAILYAVVQEYIQTARPVGSTRVARAPGVDVSPATVRSEMVDLEEHQYLVQPHTSAGRVPTAKAYRFFVDLWRGRTPALRAADRRQVNEFFASDHGEFESFLADTTGLLTDLTDWTAVVVGPSPAAATVRSAQLIDLAARTVLVVAVMSNGVVEKRTLEVPADVSPAVVADASDRLARRVVGRTLHELDDGGRQDGEGEIGGEDSDGGGEGGGGEDRLLAAALRALREARAHHEVFVGGTAKLAAAFDGVEQLGDVLRLLEQQVVMAALMRRVLDRGNRVAIGSETGVPSLSQCSLVLAPFSMGAETGTIGVLGSTRMDYPQALSAVAAVSSRLGSALREV